MVKKASAKKAGNAATKKKAADDSKKADSPSKKSARPSAKSAATSPTTATAAAASKKASTTTRSTRSTRATTQSKGAKSKADQASANRHEPPKRKSRRQIAAEVAGEDVPTDPEEILSSLESEEGQSARENDDTEPPEEDEPEVDVEPDIPAKAHAGEFGLWGSQWVAEWKATDPIWRSAESLSAHKEQFGIKDVQPLSHCEDSLFPNNAILWGLQLHKFDEDEDFSYHDVAGRGPSCYLTDTSRKSDCHYKTCSFTFLYDAPPGVECTSAKARGLPTLVCRFDSVNGHLGACAYCFYTATKHCILSKYRMPWCADRPYNDAEEVVAKRGRARNQRAPEGGYDAVAANTALLAKPDLSSNPYWLKSKHRDLSKLKRKIDKVPSSSSKRAKVAKPGASTGRSKEEEPKKKVTKSSGAQPAATQSDSEQKKGDSRQGTDNASASNQAKPPPSTQTNIKELGPDDFTPAFFEDLNSDASSESDSESDSDSDSEPDSDRNQHQTHQPPKSSRPDNPKPRREGISNSKDKPTLVTSQPAAPPNDPFDVAAAVKALMSDSEAPPASASAPVTNAAATKTVPGAGQGDTDPTATRTDLESEAAAAANEETAEWAKIFDLDLLAPQTPVSAEATSSGLRSATSIMEELKTLVSLRHHNGEEAERIMETSIKDMRLQLKNFRKDREKENMNFADRLGTIADDIKHLAVSEAVNKKLKKNIDKKSDLIESLQDQVADLEKMTEQQRSNEKQLRAELDQRDARNAQTRKLYIENREEMKKLQEENKSLSKEVDRTKELGRGVSKAWQTGRDRIVELEEDTKKLRSFIEKQASVLERQALDLKKQAERAALAEQLALEVVELRAHVASLQEQLSRAVEPAPAAADQTLESTSIKQQEPQKVGVPPVSQTSSTSTDQQTSQVDTLPPLPKSLAEELARAERDSEAASRAVRPPGQSSFQPPEEVTLPDVQPGPEEVKSAASETVPLQLTMDLAELQAESSASRQNPFAVNKIPPASTPNASGVVPLQVEESTAKDQRAENSSC